MTSKKSKKKLLIIPLAIILIALVACGGSDEEEKKTEEKESVEAIDETEKKEPKEEAEEISEREEEFTQEERDKLANTALGVLEKNLGDLGTIEYEIIEDFPTFTILPGADLTVSIAALIDNPTDDLLDSWDYMCDNIAELSKQMSDFLHEPTIVQISNPANPKKMVFGALNGQVIYDLADEL